MVPKLLAPTRETRTSTSIDVYSIDLVVVSSESLLGYIVVSGLVRPERSSHGGPSGKITALRNLLAVLTECTLIRDIDQLPMSRSIRCTFMKYSVQAESNDCRSVS